MRDILGKQLEVGQMVAFADRDGNVAVIRVGIIKNTDDPERVVIVWTANPPMGRDRSTVHVAGEVVKRHRLAVIN